jgi:hypothetical protein
MGCVQRLPKAQAVGVGLRHRTPDQFVEHMGLARGIQSVDQEPGRHPARRLADAVALVNYHDPKSGEPRPAARRRCRLSYLLRLCRDKSMTGTLRGSMTTISPALGYCFTLDESSLYISISFMNPSTTWSATLICTPS